MKATNSMGMCEQLELEEVTREGRRERKRGREREKERERRYEKQSQDI